MSPAIRLARMIGRHDHDVLVAWTTDRRPLTLRMMRGVTHCGDAAVVIAITIATIALGDGAVDQAGMIAAFTLSLSHALVQILKRGVGRPRPSLPPGACLIEAPDRFSFPSGHAAAALSVALPFAALAAPGVSGAFVAVGILVGLSRCYLGVHYPGDVIVGWTLALGSYLLAPGALGLLRLV